MLGARPVLGRFAACALPIPPDPVGRLERSRARPPRKSGIAAATCNCRSCTSRVSSCSRRTSRQCSRMRCPPCPTRTCRRPQPSSTRHCKDRYSVCCTAGHRRRCRRAGTRGPRSVRSRRDNRRSRYTRNDHRRTRFQPGSLRCRPRNHRRSRMRSRPCRAGRSLRRSSHRGKWNGSHRHMPPRTGPSSCCTPRRRGSRLRHCTMVRPARKPPSARSA